jgi:acetyltransferase-like isoleucine patch superfamily enzyme
MTPNLNQIIVNCTIGKETKLWNFINLYDCTIGDHCMIGTFVEIQSNVIIGDRVRVQSHTFICSGVTVEDDVFIGHNVVFTNDKYPSTANKDWIMEKTIVKKGASIGSGVTILPGITIGEGALIGAGSVVTKDVPAKAVVVGNPGKIINSRP